MAALATTVTPACLLDLGAERTIGYHGSDPSGGGGSSSSGGATSANGGEGTGGAHGGATSASGGGGTGGGGGGGVPVPGNCDGSEIEWALQIGSIGTELGQGLTPDGQGGVYVTGSFSWMLQLGNDNLQSSGFLDNFLSRIDDNGNPVWSRSFGDSADQLTWLLAAAPVGELIMAGGFNGTIDFGDGNPVTGDVSDAFIVRYDALGNFLWKKIYPGLSFQSVRSLVVDPQSGDIFIGGLFHDTIDLGGGLWTSTGSSDAFIARLDAQGDYVWGRQMTGVAPDYTFGVAVDGGRLLAGGSADADIDLGEGVHTTFGDGQSDPWAGLYNADNGEPIWTRVWPDNGYQVIRRAAFTTSGAPVVAGRFHDNLAFDATMATFGSGVFVAELDASGVSTDATVIGNAVSVTGLSPTSSGGLILGGYWNVSLDTSPVPIPTEGGEDGMIVALDSSLAPISALVIGSTGYDDVSGVVSDGTHAFATATFREKITLPGCDDMTPIGDADAVLLKLAP